VLEAFKTEATQPNMFWMKSVANWSEFFGSAVQPLHGLRSNALAYMVQLSSSDEPVLFCKKFASDKDWLGSDGTAGSAGLPIFSAGMIPRPHMTPRWHTPSTKVSATEWESLQKLERWLGDDFKFIRDLVLHGESHVHMDTSALSAGQVGVPGRIKLGGVELKIRVLPDLSASSMRLPAHIPAVAPPAGTASSTPANESPLVWNSSKRPPPKRARLEGKRSTGPGDHQSDGSPMQIDSNSDGKDSEASMDDVESGSSDSGSSSSSGAGAPSKSASSSSAIASSSSGSASTAPVTPRAPRKPRSRLMIDDDRDTNESPSSSSSSSGSSSSGSAAAAAGAPLKPRARKPSSRLASNIAAE